MKGYIHSFESFGTVDGPGIRFVVFFSGCPMRCLYCHNPDTWQMGGSYMSAEEIVAMMQRNLAFYKSGGLTATGGEPTMQLSFLTELFRIAKSRGIHTCLDTAGILFREDESYDELLRYTDLVMLDIKHTDPEEHRRLTGHSNENVLAFLEYLEKRKHPTRIRHVVVPGITYDEAQLAALGRLVHGKKCIESVELLSYHSMGMEKYKKMGLHYPLAQTVPLSPEELKHAYEIVNAAKNG